jgi:MFS family permease
MESSASAGRVTSAVLDPRRWLALALLCGAFFVVLLDGTITIVALLSIGAGLRFSEQGLRWALSAYALTFGSLLLLGRRAADLLGRRRVFTAGAVFFTTASLLCGLAWSSAALLAARGVQGAGAATLLRGLGIGLAFVTATVAALAGAAEHEAGLASGLSNTAALQTGTAFGVAIVTTVAVSAPSTTWQRTKARTRSPR